MFMPWDQVVIVAGKCSELYVQVLFWSFAQM